jgi:glucosamine--fructose-6-phosphate aminotransferase (isomerizing)
MTQGGRHTWTEITGQPEAWRATLGAFTANRTALEDFLNQTDLAQILVVGCGSTHYLVQTAAAILTRRTRTPAHALPSSELCLFPSTASPDQTLLLAVSRSGTTTEMLWALERFRETHGGPVLAVTCYPESPLVQQADFALVIPSGQEQSVAQTRSFTSMLLLTQALTATLAHDKGILEHLQRLPEALEDLVARLGDLPQRLGTNQDIERIFLLGGGPLHGLANEAMLKTKEMSLSYSEAYHPLEFRHGPMSMLDEHTLVVGLLSDTGLAEELRVLEDMQGLGARTLALVEDASVFTDWQADHVIELHSGLDEWERGLLYLPVLQRMAYYRAMAKGLDPDRPNNLTAVVEL